MKEPLVVYLTSILFTVAMFMMLLPFRILNIRFGEFRLFVSEKELRRHLYGDSHQPSQSI